MRLKIETPDIHIEYSDELSIIDENAKKRILEILKEVYTNQAALNEQAKKNKKDN